MAMAQASGEVLELGAAAWGEQGWKSFAELVRHSGPFPGGGKASRYLEGWGQPSPAPLPASSPPALRKSLEAAPMGPDSK